MDICLDRAEEGFGMVDECDVEYGRKFYPGDAITSEIRELYNLWVYNRKKIEILSQLNNYLTEVLSSEVK